MIPATTFLAAISGLVAPNMRPVSTGYSRVSNLCSVATPLKAVVVGGGPAGLASAWVLSERGFDVTVVERRSEPSPYEPQRAYLYLIDGRGQTFTDAARITEKLASPAVSVSSANYTVTRIMPDSKRVTVTPPILEPMDPVLGRPSYWIPRATLLSLFVDALPSSVDMLYGCEVSEIRADDLGVEVVAKAAAGDDLRLRADLLVGADGLNSAVRAKCAEWSGDDAGFTPVMLPSPSSGLAYKMLRFPASFKTAKDDPTAIAEARQAYSVRPAETRRPGARPDP